MFSDLDHTGARKDGKMEREISDFAKIHSFLDLVTSLRKGESFFCTLSEIFYPTLYFCVDR